MNAGMMAWKNFFESQVYIDLKGFAQDNINIQHRLLEGLSIEQRQADVIRGALTVYRELLDLPEVIRIVDEDKKLVATDEENGDAD